MVDPFKRQNEFSRTNLLGKRFRSYNLDHRSVALNLEPSPAPLDFVADPAQAPDHETQQIAHGDQPKIPPESFIEEPMYTYHPTHRQPHNQRRGEQH